jgi:hypothetical protein
MSEPGPGAGPEVLRSRPKLLSDRDFVTSNRSTSVRLSMQVSAGGHDSLVVMSLLNSGYQARVALGLAL